MKDLSSDIDWAPMICIELWKFQSYYLSVIDITTCTASQKKLSVILLNFFCLKDPPWDAKIQKVKNKVLYEELWRLLSNR